MHFGAVIFSTWEMWGWRGDACRIFHASICSLKTHKSLFVARRGGTCPGPGDSDRMPWPGLQDSWDRHRSLRAMVLLAVEKEGAKILYSGFSTFFLTVIVRVFVSLQTHMLKP